MLPTKGQREVDSVVKEYLYCAEFDVPEEGRHKLEDEEEVGDKYSGSAHLHFYESATGASPILGETQTGNCGHFSLSHF